ncbi:MAG: CoA transferase [Candidatus Tectomicrobia bacterium]|nr:CoA transferase [Candidatus Tectomicrobia bacterium]
MAQPLPLEGFTILEVADIWAGPFAVTLLADMGAKVIKVEAIQRFRSRGQQIHPPPNSPGYPENVPGERPWNRAVGFNWVNRNKLGITLDLTRLRGVELYKQLVKMSDVILENFAAGTMERLGIDYPVMKEVKPDIIMISMPGFGVAGSYKGYVGLGMIFDAMAGHAAIRGYPDREPPGTSGTVHTDMVSALTGAFAVLVALHYKSRTGKGQFIDLSQVEGFIPHLGEVILDYTINKRLQKPVGNRHPFMAPHGVYRCKGTDKWIAIAISSDKEWQQFCQALGNPPWSQREEFSGMLSRLKHQDELDKLIEEWTAEHDHYEIMELLQKAGVPSGPILDNQEIYSDPHVKGRGFFEVVAHPEAGTHPYPGMLWKMSKTPGSIRQPTNCLGEHNEYVFKTMLGLSDDEIAELAKEEIIGTVPLEGSEVSKRDLM